MLAPESANCVGLVDASALSFTCLDLIPSWADNGFWSAVATPSGDVVFGPYSADAVCVYSDLGPSVSCVDISSTLTMDWKFLGAAASSSGVVVFSPRYADCFGEFDPATSTFECHDVTTEQRHQGPA